MSTTGPLSLAAFLDVSGELLAGGYRVRFEAEGWSMHPTIRNNDLIIVVSVAPSEISRGDIVLYRDRRGVTAHRVVGIERQRAVTMFVLRGDATEGCDAPVTAGQVLGKVLAVERAGRRINVAGTSAKLLWVLRACRCYLIRAMFPQRRRLPRRFTSRV